MIYITRREYEEIAQQLDYLPGLAESLTRREGEMYARLDHTDAITVWGETADGFCAGMFAYNECGCLIGYSTEDRVNFTEIACEEHRIDPEWYPGCGAI